jgi:hypothetical protein
VQAWDTSSDLDYASTTALVLSGWTIQDAATNNAILTLPSPWAEWSLWLNKNIVIDTTKPTCTSFTYNPASWPVNTNVTATCNASEIVTYQQPASTNVYTFTANGSYVFNFTDTAGNTWSSTATVNRIDTTIPTASIHYDPDTTTNQNVTAMLTWFSKTWITITNNAWSPIYVFTWNSTFTFQFIDLAGNTGSTLATVNWIDQVWPTLSTWYISFWTTWYNSPNYYYTSGVSIQSDIIDAAWLSTGTCMYTLDGNTRYPSLYSWTTTTWYCYQLDIGWWSDLYIRFSILDLAGNIWYSSTWLYLYDWVWPTRPLSFFPSNQYRQSTWNIQLLRWSSIDNGIGLSWYIRELSIDNFDTIYLSWTTTNTWIQILGLANNTYFWRVRAFDRLGQSWLSSLANIFTIDSSLSAAIQYSTTWRTNKEVLATLTWFSQTWIIITNNSGSNEYTFYNNGDFTFYFQDSSGNLWEATATVNWMDPKVVGLPNTNKPSDIAAVLRDVWNFQKLTWGVLSRDWSLYVWTKHLRLNSKNPVLLEPVILFGSSADELSKAEVLIQSGTRFVKKNSNSYSGIVYAPEFISHQDISLPNWLKPLSVISVWAVDEEVLIKKQNYTNHKSTIAMSVPWSSSWDSLTIYYSNDWTNRSYHWETQATSINDDTVVVFDTNHFTMFAVWSITRDNTDFLDSNFWAASPTSWDIIQAIYGSWIWDTTAYNKYRTWLCNPANISVVNVANYASSWADIIPQNLSANTIYVLWSGWHVTTRQIAPNTCSAIVWRWNVKLHSAGQPSWRPWSIIAISSKSWVVLDNIQIDGKYNINGTTHAINNYWIYSEGSVLWITINNIEVAYSAGDAWIYLQNMWSSSSIYLNRVQSHNNTNRGLYLRSSWIWIQNAVFDNLEIFNNSSYGMAIEWLSYITVSNSKFYNNANHGIFTRYTSEYNSFNNIASFNNVWAWLYIDYNGYNVINNSSFYNNTTYWLILANSSNNTLHNIKAYNNDTWIFVQQRWNTNKYYGTLQRWYNTTANYAGTNLSDSALSAGTNWLMGWSNGWYSTMWWSMSCDYAINPNNSSSSLLSSPCSSKWYSWWWSDATTFGVTYDFGDLVQTQLQPVYYINSSTITWANLAFDPNQFITYAVVWSTSQWDTTPPILSRVSSVPTPTNNTTPNYTFSSNESWTITYGWSCSSSTTLAVSWNNTITFNELSDWTYSDCTITVTDAASNESSPLSVNTFTIDATSPYVTNVSASTADWSYKEWADIDITVTFSELVYVWLGVPALRLNTTPIARTWSYISWHSTNTLTFRYTVQAWDTAADLDYASTTALVLSGWSIIRDLVGNNSILTLASPWAAWSLGYNKDIVIDTTAPILATVTPVTTPTNDTTPSYTFSSTESWTITYGWSCSWATTSAISWNNTITFNELSASTYSNCTITVTDAASNASTALTVPSFTIDTTAPTASIHYDPDTTTNQNVTATLTWFSKTWITITNNAWSPIYVFTWNGTFTFEFIDLAGNTWSQLATVDWIQLTASHSITNISLDPSLNISRFAPYTLIAQTSWTMISWEVNLGVLDGDNNSCRNYYADGTCDSETMIFPLVNSGDNTRVKTSIYPDYIYPEIFFAPSTITWSNAPLQTSINRSSYHIFKMTNPFAMVDEMSFWIELNAVPNNTNNSSDLLVYLVWNDQILSDFTSDWRNNSNVELVGTLNRNSTFNHVHTINSSHHLVALATNPDWTIGNKNINVSWQFWIVLYQEAPNTNRWWNLRYQSSSLCTSTGSWYRAWSFTTPIQQAWCPDAHIHIARRSANQDLVSADITMYYQDGENISTITGNSTFSFGTPPNMPPNQTSFTNPLGLWVYNTDINIWWNPVSDPNNDALLYNLYLLSSTWTRLSTIATWLSTTWYLRDISLISDGEYWLELESCDPWLLCSQSYLDDNFFLDKTPATIIFTWATPPDQSTLASNNFTTQIQIQDNLWLDSFAYIYDWTTYNIYDSWLLLMYNLDNISSLWETTSLVQDFSIYSNTGTIYGSPQHISSWVWNGAYSFDGSSNQYISIWDGLWVNLWTTHTISVWINPATNTWAIIGQMSWVSAILLSGDRVYYGVWPWDNVYFDTNISLNTRTHITIVRDSNNVWLYLNGSLVSTKTLSTNTPLDIFYIAKEHNAGSNEKRFSWYIDELLIYDRVLSTWEISQIYRSNLSVWEDKIWSYTTDYSCVATWWNYVYSWIVIDRASNISAIHNTTTIIMPSPLSNISAAPASLGQIDFSYDIQSISGQAQDYFKVIDRLWKSPWYTTIALPSSLQSSINPSYNISWSNIYFKSDGINTISGVSTDNIYVVWDFSDYVNLQWASTYISRDQSDIPFMCKWWIYGDKPYFKVEIPGWQSIGSYTGTITYDIVY